MHKIEFNMSFDDYKNAPGLNFSSLKNFRESPKHFKHWLEHSQSSGSMSVGSAVHKMILEPHDFYRNFAVFDGRRQGKKWDEFRQQNQGCHLLTQKQYLDATAIADAVAADEVASGLIKKPGPAEVSMFADLGLKRVKVRIDKLINGGEAIVDIKTTVDASPYAFAKHIHQYAYHAQAALYGDVCRAVLELDEMPDCYLVAVENKAPHDVVVYKLREQAIDLGRELYQEWIDKYLECEETDRWEGAGQGEINEIDVPAYAYAEDRCELIIGGEEVLL